MLRRFSGFKTKRAYTNSCTPCLTLKPEIACQDLCCRQYLVVLAQEDLDDGLVTLAPFVDVLRKAANGSCHYLDEATGNCGAWEHRPLVCRTYDCRDDTRVTWKMRVGIKHPVETIFEDSHPERCTHCDRTLRLCAAVAHASDGHALCIDCGQPYDMLFSYREKFFRIEALDDIPPAVRRKYLFTCHLWREDWTAALEVLEPWCLDAPDDLELQQQRALMWAELGRTAEARRELERLRVNDPLIELDLAWLDTREHNDASAKRRVESVLEQLSAQLSPPVKLRANLQLGLIDRRANRIEEAARKFQTALLIDRTHPSHIAGIKEYLLELLHGAPDTRERVERGLLRDR